MRIRSDVCQNLEYILKMQDVLEGDVLREMSLRRCP
jgi:hypothetical protein